MVLPASIGVYPHEHAAPQRIRINVDLGVSRTAGRARRRACRAGVGRDELSRVVDYERVAHPSAPSWPPGTCSWWKPWPSAWRKPALTDDRIELVRIRVEKLDVFDDLASVGVEIERRRTTCPPRTVDSQEVSALADVLVA